MQRPLPSQKRVGERNYIEEPTKGSPKGRKRCGTGTMAKVIGLFE